MEWQIPSNPEGIRLSVALNDIEKVRISDIKQYGTVVDAKVHISATMKYDIGVVIQRNINLAVTVFTPNETCIVGLLEPYSMCNDIHEYIKVRITDLLCNLPVNTHQDGKSEYVLFRDENGELMDNFIPV